MRNRFCFRNFLLFLYIVSSRNREFSLYSSNLQVKCSCRTRLECLLLGKSNYIFSLEPGKPFSTYGLLLGPWLFHKHGPNPTYWGVVEYLQFSYVREWEWILLIYLTILQQLVAGTCSREWESWIFFLAVVLSLMTQCVCKMPTQTAIHSTVKVHFLPDFLGYNGHLVIFDPYGFKDFLQHISHRFRHGHLNSHSCPRQVRPLPNLL